MAEGTAAEAALVDGSGGGDGGSVVLAGYGQETETPGAVESRGGAAASGRLEASAGVEERATKGHGGGSLDQVVEEAETSAVREPQTDLGKAPIVEGEPVVEPMVEDTPPMFVGSGTGAGSSRHIGMGDYLATASMADVLEVVRGYPGLAEALLASREAELQAELGAGGVREPEVTEERVDEEAGGVMAPRSTVVDEVTLALQGRGAYDEATYVPFQHVVVPSLFDPYTPRRPTYDEALVLKDPQQHLSLRRDEAISLSCYGGSAAVPTFWERLPGAVQGIVRQAGFGEFVGVLARGVCNDRPVVRALAERWWDTTNTFHFSFGELTVTPLDFAAITGLRVGGDPIPFDIATGRQAAFQREMLGYELKAEADDAKYAQLLGFWTERLPTDRVEEEQMARCFLLYLLGASLFPNRRNRVHLSLLPALRDVGEIARFDWGGAALGTCYAFMGSLSRGAGVSLGGY
ncbi:hypothetical protein RHMOL_Rhmol06G0159300 [Rhododendron molle]|uniref:Uncharacterized protein n=1 Tax=Rhododendron molle TaxID=49168 RepID=A0ACC0NE26_RHOML|nr:hypothetical protein RHMOL_Rhmol06G0159300 [Rhododendron molle]